MAAPTVTGPIDGGVHGRPFARPLVDLDAYGYVEEEWFLDGEATSYEVQGEMTRDGRWTVTPRTTAPFRTRVVVYRPADAAQASGVAVVCWNNVSAGYELFGGESPEILENGHAFVGVTVQKVGVHGLESSRMGLVDWDPERYGSLHHPGDDYSFDIYTQAAQAVRSGQLGDLRADRLVAMGASQSAGRLVSYINGVHPLARAFDGYLVQIWFGSGTSFSVGDAVVDLSKPQATPRAIAQHQLRDDLDVPVFVVNSELEATPCYPVRQPDTDRFRYWEAAGTSHVSAQVQAMRAVKFERDFGKSQPLTPTTNRVPILPLYDSALHHLVRWIDEGTPPPVQPRIEFAGDRPAVVRDEHGIGVGGIRLPQAEVPIAHNSAIAAGDNVFARLNGSWEPFPDDKVRSLYGDRATYLARFEEAARAAEKAGVLLARDVDALLAEAADAWPLTD
jgi:hypothetical protein